MATYRELTYDILNIARGGQSSDDDLMSLDQIGFWIKNTRAMLIRQDLNKKRSMGMNLTQSLGCVPVDYFDDSTCCDVVSGCKILRTVDKIPKPIEVDFRDLITRVGPASISKPAYTIIPYNRVEWTGNNQFTKQLPKAFYFDRYVYVLNPPLGLEYINIVGVWEDPEEVRDYNNCDGTECYTDDSEFPISNYMIEAMKQIVISNNLKFILVTPTDQTGNAKQDVEQQATPQTKTR